MAVSKRNKYNDEIIKFGDSSKKFANKPSKLSKLRKTLKSKKLSKNRNLLKNNAI